MPKFTVKIRQTLTSIATFEHVTAPDEDAAVESIIALLDKEGSSASKEWELEDEEFEYEEVFEE